LKEWALKWAQGVILGFCRGKIELNRVIGMLRRAEKYGVKSDELLSIIEVIEESPVYLPFMSNEEKRSKLKPLKEIFNKGDNK